MRRHTLASLLGVSLSITAVVNCSDSDSGALFDDPSGGSAGSGGSGQAGSSSGGNAGSGGSGQAGSSSGAQSVGGTESIPMGGNATAGTATSGGGGFVPAGGGMRDAGGAGGAIEPPSGGAGGDGVSLGEGGNSAGAAGAGPVDDKGPLLKYDFDEGAGTVVGDSSGHAANGTNSDAAGWSANGRNGAAVAMSGGNPPTRYVSVPSGLLSNVTAFTMAAWVNMNTDSGWNRILDFGNGAVGPDRRFLYVTPASDKGIRFSVFGGDVKREATVVTHTRLPLSVWKHVAVTADSGEYYVYVDGFPAGHASTVIVPAFEMEPLAPNSWLGKSRFPDGGFDGLMDELVIYERALGGNEIADLAWPKSDYSSWRFDEAAGTSAHDSSDRAIDATLEDGAVWTSGRQGAGVQLAGTTERVSFASNPLAGCTTAATLSIWIKLNAASQWSRILDFGAGMDAYMFLTPRNATGALQFTMHTAAKDTTLVSNTTVPLDAAWHHVAAVVSPTAATLFLDGVSVANLPTPAVSPADLGDMTENWLGHSRFAADANLNASLDQLRISCRAYTADEIKNLAFK